MTDFWNSLKDSAESLGGAVAAPAGAVLDLAQMPFDNKDDAALYVQKILLRDHVARLPEADRDAYARAVVEETVRRRGAPYVADYVRLDLWATK